MTVGDIDSARPRGRPRKFDISIALERARALFHKHGVDGVSVAQLTEAMGITPPSFYKAFGSKAGLFARVVDRFEGDALDVYAGRIDTAPDTAAAAAEFIATFTGFYAAEGQPPGCFVQEATRSVDEAIRERAEASARAAPDLVAAALDRDEDRDVADLVAVLMSGLSAQARRGLAKERVIAVGKLAERLVAGEVARKHRVID